MQDTMSEVVQVVTTLPTQDGAEKIACNVVTQRLAASAQVSGPVTSYYWWEDKLEQTQEWVCRMKTRRALYGRLEDAIRSLHPYEVPEILALPVVDGNPDYLRWISDETEGKNSLTNGRR